FIMGSTLFWGADLSSTYSDSSFALPESPRFIPKRQTLWRARAQESSNEQSFLLDEGSRLRQILGVRAHGMWTYEPRQGRNAATAVCSASAVVTLAFQFTFSDRRHAPPATAVGVHVGAGLRFTGRGHKLTMALQLGVNRISL